MLSAGASASSSSSASHQLVGVVEPVVGVTVSADGTVSGLGGTTAVTVTRESYGATTIVTIIPR